MKYKIWIFLLTFIATVLSINARADSPVWRISKGEDHLFLGGTIHVLSHADYPLPKAFEQAYRQAEQLVLEVDESELNSPQFQQAVLSEMLYQDGRTLETVLQPETFQALAQHLKSRGIPLQDMLKFKPAMAAITLSMIELQSLGLAGTGVDQFFSLRAVNDGKPMGHLETVAEQLAFLATMGQGVEDAMINHTLRDLDDLPKMMDAMKAAWRKGDNKKLEEVALTPWKGEFPQVYQSLLVERNNAWMPEIQAMLKTDEVELVLVGALHLVGEDGLLTQLASRGYTVKKL